MRTFEMHGRERSEEVVFLAIQSNHVTQIAPVPTAKMRTPRIGKKFSDGLNEWTVLKVFTDRQQELLYAQWLLIGHEEFRHLYEIRE